MARRRRHLARLAISNDARQTAGTSNTIMSNPESQKQEPTLIPIDQEDQVDVLELLSRAENIIAGITPFDEKRPS